VSSVGAASRVSNENPILPSRDYSRSMRKREEGGERSASFGRSRSRPFPSSLFNFIYPIYADIRRQALTARFVRQKRRRDKSARSESQPRDAGDRRMNPYPYRGGEGLTHAGCGVDSYVNARGVRSPPLYLRRDRGNS